jgi:hypothetical protein
MASPRDASEGGARGTLVQRYILSQQTFTKD